jgi:hypothetical protein
VERRAQPARLGEPHGIRFFDDWIPELKAAYNVRVMGE